MNKWIYSSVTLNICALLGLIHTITFQIITTSNPQAYGEVMGFYWFCANIICLVILLAGCLLEYFLYKKNPDNAFKFPYNKLQSKLLKIIYYIILYNGLVWGAGFLIIVFFLYTTITNLFLL